MSKFDQDKHLNYQHYEDNLKIVRDRYRFNFSFNSGSRNMCVDQILNLSVACFSDWKHFYFSINCILFHC